MITLTPELSYTNSYNHQPKQTPHRGLLVNLNNLPKPGCCPPRQKQSKSIPLLTPFVALLRRRSITPTASWTIPQKYLLTSHARERLRTRERGLCHERRTQVQGLSVCWKYTNTNGKQLTWLPTKSGKTQSTSVYTASER